jgi:hypothetical protein
MKDSAGVPLWGRNNQLGIICQPLLDAEQEGLSEGCWCTMLLEVGCEGVVDILGIAHGHWVTAAAL